MRKNEFRNSLFSKNDNGLPVIYMTLLVRKLSLIGLKSDLAGKLISRNPKAAEKELRDIRQTASTALNEVRDLVADIRMTKVKDELIRVKQILKAAEMDVKIQGIRISRTSLP